MKTVVLRICRRCFNTQPPEGGWLHGYDGIQSLGCFNTQPPEGGWVGNKCLEQSQAVSTHSRPKAAGPKLAGEPRGLVCFNTQPPEGGWLIVYQSTNPSKRFQHTAARRRLEPNRNYRLYLKICFNTQPPEGGWFVHVVRVFIRFVSTHSRPKAAGDVVPAHSIR